MEVKRAIGANSLRQWCHRCLLAGLLIASASPAAGDTLEWNAPGGGLFADPDHWDGPAAPDATTDAVFGLSGAGAYTVTFDANAASRTVTVGVGNEVSFALSGFEYATGDPGQSDPCRIGAFDESVWSDGALTVSGGEWVLDCPLLVGADGHAGSSLTVTAGGQVEPTRLDAYGNVTVDGDTADLSVGTAGVTLGADGLLNLLNGGQATVVGTVDAHGAVSITGDGSSLLVLDTLTAHGPVTITDSGRAWGRAVNLYGLVTVDDAGWLTANELLNVARDPDGAGRLISANGAIVSAATAEISGTVVLDGADFVAFGGIAVKARGLLTGNGGVGGPLTVGSGGTLAPGMSVGTIRTQPVIFEADSLLAIEVASAAADLLEITGDLDLSAGSAALLAMPWGGDMYTVGSTFTVITYTGSRNGTFGSVTGEGIYFDVTYDDANKKIDLTTLALPIPGDANLDGVVDDTDLGVMLGNWGGADVNWAKGDFTGDNILDDGDLNVLLGNWTRPGGTPIPAPAPLALLAFGAGALLRRRRKGA